MEISRFAAVVASLVFLVVLAPVVAVGTVAAADTRVTVTDTTVTPDTPAAGAPITAETTVRLSAGSNSSLRLDEVQVVDSDGETLGTATDLGRLSPGETLTVPVTFSVDTPQSYDLTLIVRGTDVDGDTVRATRPLTVGVERASPQVELRTDGLVAGATTPVQAVISNPTTAALRGITVQVTDPASGERLRRTAPTLAAGQSTTLNFSVSAAETGQTNLTVATTYTTPTGTEATVTFTRLTTAEPLSDDVGVRVGPTQQADAQQQVPSGIAGLLGTGGSGALQPQDSDDDADGSTVGVTVTNFGNAAVERVILSARTGNGTTLDTVGRFAVTDRLEPGESVTVQPSLESIAGVGRIEFVAAYDLRNGSRETSVVGYDFVTDPGTATLTGIDVTVDEDGRVLIDGNLANTGDGELRSAVVTVEASEYVLPAYPQRNYFVGTVASSEFAPFELTARADTQNATSIPVRIVYTAGPDRVTERIELPMPADDGTDASGTELQTVGIVAGLVGGLAVTVSVPMLLRRRRRQER